jgi:hypothetical protein
MKIKTIKKIIEDIRDEMIESDEVDVPSFLFVGAAFLDFTNRLEELEEKKKALKAQRVTIHD